MNKLQLFLRLVGHIEVEAKKAEDAQHEADRLAEVGNMVAAQQKYDLSKRYEAKADKKRELAEMVKHSDQEEYIWARFCSKHHIF